MNRKPTMKDVAREAGVALGTVSKVFNNIPVGEEYRRKVETAAERLGYQVNNYARGLKTNKTNVVALIMPSLHHPFFAAMTDELTTALMKRGYRIMLASSRGDFHTEQDCVDMLRQNKVDGIIALTYNPGLVIDSDLPFVSIDRYYGANIPCISADNFGGGQLAAEKLVQLGCKKLLFLRTGSSLSAEPDKRGIGFETYCRAAGVDYEVFKLGDVVDMQPFVDFLRTHLVEGKLEFDGVFCSTDNLACHIVDILRRLGQQVPRDVQVIGFDGIPNYISGQYYCSTIVQPVASMAEAAVSTLLSAEHDKVSALMCLPVSYQPGGTTRD